MVDWRSSRLFEVTRNSSPWICDFTVFGPSSRMIFETFFASSEEMPFFSDTSMRYSLPLAYGSPVSRLRSEMPRLMNLASRTSSTAFTRSSADAFSSSFSPDHSTDAPTFLKSYRVAISFCAWLTALSASILSTLLTMSNVESAMTTVYWETDAWLAVPRRWCLNRPTPCILVQHLWSGDHIWSGAPRQVTQAAKG